MVGFRLDAARRRRLAGRVSGLAAATGLLLVAACTSGHPASDGGSIASAAPSGTSAAGATSTASPAASPAGGSAVDCDSVATCYTPQQLQVAYGIKPLLDRGIDGQGETVVLPELAESRVNPPWVTDMRQDMTAFDRLYHLPAARMRVDSTLAGARSPWLAFGEEVLDVEMVHALAPDATLVILLLPTNSLDNTANTVSAAVGALRLGSAEGGVLSISAAAQIGPPQRQPSMISNAGGTSASAPIWAALIALADQYAGHHLGFVNPAIYQVARGPGYHQAFHDITTGNNTVEFPPRTIAGYRAAPGWDPVTGWGSPDAQVLVPLLARYADT